MGFAFRVHDMRVGPWGSALAFFNLAFGNEADDGAFTPLVVVKEFALKEKKAGGLWYQAPSKLRIRNGEPVLNDQGYKIYDPYFDLFCTDKGNDRYGPTSEAWEFREKVLAELEKQFAAQGGDNEGRGGSKAPAKATQAEIDEPEGESPLDEEDDDLPF